MLRYFLRTLSGKSGLQKALHAHFRGRSLGDIVTAARDFPITARVDVQVALQNLFAGKPGARLFGIHAQHFQDTPTIALLLSEGPFPIDVGPLQHDDVDIGDATPVRCLKNALWLSVESDLPFAVLLGPAMRYGQVGGVHVEIAVPAAERGADFSQALF